MTKFREHRGQLADAMKTVVEVNSLQELIDHIHQNIMWVDPKAKITVTKYGPPGRIDERIGWDTHIVMAGTTPVGFTDGPLT